MNSDRRDFLRMITALGAAPAILPLAASASQKTEKKQNGKRPNIVCFIADDTDFSMLSCFGGPVPTPNIDSIAAKGMVFTDAHCVSPICTPSRYNILTGQYASRCTDSVFLHDCPYNDLSMIEHNVYLNQEIPTVGTALSAAGYRTGFVGKWHLGHSVHMMPVPRIAPDANPDDPKVRADLIETQRYFDERAKKDSGFDFAGAIVWGNCEFYPLDSLKTHHLEWSTQIGLDFLDTCKKNQPFFLWFASTIIHGPGIEDAIYKDPKLTPVGRQSSHLASMPSRQSVLDRVKAADCRPTHQAVGSVWLDDQVGAFLKKIRDMGEEENTLFVFLTDNNLEPGKGTCHRTGTHIPFIAKYPPMIAPGSTCPARVQTLDLLPTFLQLAHASPSPGMKLDGFSLVPLFENPKSGEIRDVMFFEMGYTRAVQVGDWRYIAFRIPNASIAKMKSGATTLAPNYTNRHQHPQSVISSLAYKDYFAPDQLYNLADDPDESVNLADDPKYKAKLDEMKALLKTHLAQFRHPFPIDNTEFYSSPTYLQGVEETKKSAEKNLPDWWPVYPYIKLDGSPHKLPPPPAKENPKILLQKKGGSEG